PAQNKIRVVFTVDFNEGGKNGNCGTINRFAWAKDRPGKSMFFVGWIYDGSAGLPASDINDTDVAKTMGSSTPNVVSMFENGSNSDKTAGTNISSIYFDVPRSSPRHVLLLGTTYTRVTSATSSPGTEERPRKRGQGQR